MLAPVLVAAASLPASGATAQPPPEKHLHGTVTVKRDRYGTPHIYSDNTYGLFYGYGHAAGQDRLFQLEMTKRAAAGSVSEVLGADYSDFDASVRSDYDPASIRRQYDELAPRDRQVLDGYASGMNAWIDQVAADRAHLMPKQFLDLGFEPSRWTGVDVAMITVGTMNIRFSDYNSEIKNLAMLQQLQQRYGAEQGRQVFDQIAWPVDPEAPASIEAPTGPAATAPAALDRPNGLAGTLDGVTAPASTPAPDIAPKPTASAAWHEAAQQIDSLRPGAAKPPQFSNMMLVGGQRAQGANSLLLNGPQFGWFSPAYTYSVGLHGAGFDVVGNTPFAYPVVLFGHNGSIAWGATAGNGDTVDMYQEKLDPNDPHRYLYQGEYRTMSQRTETVEVKDGAPRQVQVFSTVHGPVTQFDTANGVAYAKKRSWAGQELDTLFTWLRSTQASDYQQWHRQAEALPISINWYYTDRRGNIGYYFAGHFPIRPAGQDPRLPASGTGEMEWLGVQPPATGNPQVLNPPAGYLANWNNSPAPGYPNSDSLPWGRADRVEVLQRELAADPAITADDLWEIQHRASLTDINRAYFTPFLADAAAGLPADSPEHRVYQALSDWDGMNADEDHDGRYDSAGTAIIQTWLQIMLDDVVRPNLPPETYARYGSTGYPTRDKPASGSQNVQPGTKVLLNTLLGAESSVPQHVDFLRGRDRSAVVRDTLRRTYDALSQQYGPDPANWLAPTAQNVFSTSNYLGVPSGGQDEQRKTPVFMNRGTENNLVVSQPDGMAGYEVVPPGQNGFVAPDGTRGPHFDDQFQMFVDYGRKPTWLTEDEVRRNQESEESLRY
ncbi:penicillin acylase family protein [Saccharopolyspora sp. NPDC002686]|uniref:penicillin acylase family protein n=1 Tax=Saccharopolyspora sp. NPDC002686 TaxID=3154541 RepID=UPI00331FFDE8